jgi:hypothetical protein
MIEVQKIKYNFSLVKFVVSFSFSFCFCCCLTQVPRTGKRGLQDHAPKFTEEQNLRASEHTHKKLRQHGAENETSRKYEEQYDSNKAVLGLDEANETNRTNTPKPLHDPQHHIAPLGSLLASPLFVSSHL